jgi:hypothetical protein
VKSLVAARGEDEDRHDAVSTVRALLVDLLGTDEVARLESDGEDGSSASAGLSGHVLFDHRQGLVQLVGRAELDDFGAGVQMWEVSGSYVVGLAGADDRVAVVSGVLELPLEHDTPMRTLTTIVGQTPEQFGEIGVCGVRT